MSAQPALGVTPSQTVGPFFAPALLRDVKNVLTTDSTEGERIRIEGKVFDGIGNVVPDALIEIWQANSHGKFNHPRDRRDLPLDPEFGGYGRSGTDDDGVYWFETIKPGAVPFEGDQLQAPHISVIVHARGMLNHAQTRLYFEDEAANGADPVLALVPADRRSTLIARREQADGGVTYRLDIVLQGRGETVFFNI
ncbi:MAG TPA: protocatechuate 3,4-dioxygenase subunit alpha [Chloroflexota bacterium]|nr:protocatechuate 3,4-dioxygenase subunit alpha [Chloroflexota bacterium]